ncbi:MAG: PIN domain-containing protein, partial [Aggregatilineales bacterium]
IGVSMNDGIIDTSVLIHYYRKQNAARIWIDNQSAKLSITSVTWMEFMRGASSKANQVELKTLLNRFELVYLTEIDQQWAMQQLEKHQFSHRIGMGDCLIASVAHRLQIPLYTHNLKHMIPLLDALAIQPYS